jgi:cytochrome o ubiquinol oxidase subunit 1
VLLVNVSLGHRRVCTHRLARLSAAIGTQQFSPGVGVDYYLWALQISGSGHAAGGHQSHHDHSQDARTGMSYTRMPIFCWTALASNLLIVAAFPILTATFAMLLLDRYLGFHFFTNDLGGNPMMYINLIWAWGHPEVYILILARIRRVLRGDRDVFRQAVVRLSLHGDGDDGDLHVLSFVVWLHHFFTMGAGADVNGFFGIMTMIIAVPTGVKVFNWLFTLYGGRVRFQCRSIGRWDSW